MSFVVALLCIWADQPAHAQKEQVEKTIVSGIVVDHMRQPAAGVRVAYKTPEDVRADAEAYMRSRPQWFWAPLGLPNPRDADAR